ncbi:hypothetical protein [Hymenobacter lapidarius]|uniref:hypothetical protein n=1 Tax=Hymenobacter lapidarius TaxID=1908237 RepID=UPI00130162B3|nr:hypothetical protein [Hymenobacter lapidarius]
MKHTLYSMMLAGGLLLFTAPAVYATAAGSSPENPTATPRKAAATARTAKAKAAEST